MSISPDPGGALPREEPPRPRPFSNDSPAAGGDSATGKWFPPAVIVALVLVIGGLIFLSFDLSSTRQSLQLQIVELKDRQEADRHRLEAADERNARLREELSTTKQSLGRTAREVSQTQKTAKELETEQKQAAAQLGTQISSLREEATGKMGAISGEVTGVKTDVAATRKDLDATKAQLKSALGDLGVQSGLIARNHDELLELRRRGERNYFEFNLTKEKNPRKIGDISIRLTKSDAKKNRYTLEVLAEDKRFEKKDKTVNEPVQFYVNKGRGIPYEIVVNQVDKDRVVGYLATPK